MRRKHLEKVREKKNCMATLHVWPLKNNHWTQNSNRSLQIFMSDWLVAVTAICWWGGRCLLAHVSNTEYLPCKSYCAVYQTEGQSWVSHSFFWTKQTMKRLCPPKTILLLKCDALFSFPTAFHHFWMYRSRFLWHQDSTSVGSLWKGLHFMALERL